MFDTIENIAMEIYYAIAIFAMELFFALKWGFVDWMLR